MGSVPHGRPRWWRPPRICPTTKPPGTYSTPERAEASADSMLERGLIFEARVVTLPSRRARHQ